MASYEIRGKSIRAIISLPDGKKKSATFDTKAEAKAWAEEQEHRKLLGKLTSARNLTVGDLFKAYLPVAEKTDSGRVIFRRRLHQLTGRNARCAGDS